MSERMVENNETEVPEIPEILEKVMLFVLDEAKEKLSQGADIVPFTALVINENLFIENHPGDSADECFAAAKHSVQGARGADGYAFCYDGYIDTDAGVKDALIAEGGIPGEEDGAAIGYLYSVVDGKPVFEEEPAYIGEAPNFMADLKEADEYDDDEIDEKYVGDEFDEEFDEADEE